MLMSFADFLDLLDKYNSSLPDEEDLNGVIAALLRLQDTYQIPPKRIADGTFTPAKNSPQLSAADCFYFGKKAHETQDYYHVILWMQQALDAVERELNPTVSKALVLDYYAYALHMQGNPRHAKYWTEKWLELEPDHQRARDNVVYFGKEIEKENSELISRSEPVPAADVLPPIKNDVIGDSYRKSQEFRNYEALCRGEDVMPNPDVHKLKCFYTTSNNNPILVLAPVKVEEAFLSPRIVIFHDVISDKEIAIVKEISIPKLKRATVNDPATGKLVYASYRVSRSGWLTDAENATVRTLSNRISALAGLSMERAELLQVQNYGIGGQYEPHFDFARDKGPESKAFSPADGNRIATWIYYFSDVDAGGSTVFTSIGARINPRKGSAAFWFNLLKSGRGDERTRHAGCPVLSGSKWGE